MAFSRRLRLARLRRGLTQEHVAEMASITRKTYVALEAGSAGTSLAVVVKVLGVLGYTDRLAEILASDPIGEDMEAMALRRPGRR